MEIIIILEATDCIQHRMRAVPNQNREHVRIYFVLNSIFGGRKQTLNATSNSGLKGEFKAEKTVTHFSMQVNKT